MYQIFGEYLINQGRRRGGGGGGGGGAMCASANPHTNVLLGTVQYLSGGGGGGGGRQMSLARRNITQYPLSTKEN